MIGGQRNDGGRLHPDRVGLAAMRHDVNVLGRSRAHRATQRSLEHRLVADQLQKLFGIELTTQGPKPRSASTGQHNGVKAVLIHGHRGKIRPSIISSFHHHGDRY
jgi:hypothetical protein